MNLYALYRNLTAEKLQIITAPVIPAYIACSIQFGRRASLGDKGCSGLEYTAIGGRLDRH